MAMITEDTKPSPTPRPLPYLPAPNVSYGNNALGDGCGGNDIQEDNCQA